MGEQRSLAGKTRQYEGASLIEQISVLASFMMLPEDEARRLDRLPLTREGLDEHDINRSSRGVFTRWWGLGLPPLAQLALPGPQENPRGRH